MRRFRPHIILILWCYTATSVLCAQQATAELDTTQYRIGEWIPLHLEVTAPKESNIQWPLIDTEIEGMEVLKRTAVDSTIDGVSKTLQQTLTLTVFDSGYYPVPAFDFIVDEDTISTLPMVLRIHTVPLDTTMTDIKPIKDPIEAPLTLKELLPYIFGAAGLLALLALAFWFWKTRKKIEVEEKIPEIVIPAHEWAEKELASLKADKLWQRGEIKLYYIRLTDILRQYIELRYRQPAMESTTDEIMDQLRIHSLDKSLLERVRSTLVLSDFVKFAKAKPIEHEHDQSFETVSEFVRATLINESASES